MPAREKGALRALISLLLLSACSSPQPERVERSGHVDQRTLPAAGSMPSYAMAPQEQFRMPAPLRTVTPALPAELLQHSLPPTTICVRIVVTAEGSVQRVDVLDDRFECRDGARPENAALATAVRTQLLEWTFVPAAICTWPMGTRPPDVPCSGATQVRPVPVTLLYAFTFEVREGKATVRSEGTH